MLELHRGSHGCRFGFWGLGPPTTNALVAAFIGKAAAVHAVEAEERGEEKGRARTVALTQPELHVRSPRRRTPQPEQQVPARSGRGKGSPLLHAPHSRRSNTSHGKTPRGSKRKKNADVTGAAAINEEVREQPARRRKLGLGLGEEGEGMAPS